MAVPGWEFFAFSLYWGSEAKGNGRPQQSFLSFFNLWVIVVIGGSFVSKLLQESERVAE